MHQQLRTWRLQVDLVLQQAEVLRLHTPLRVAGFVGSMGLDFWDRDTWRAAIADQDVLVMTAQILLNVLRHAILTARLRVLKFCNRTCCAGSAGRQSWRERW